MKHLFRSLAFIVLPTLSACSTTTPDNAFLTRAHRERQAESAKLQASSLDASQLQDANITRQQALTVRNQTGSTQDQIRSVENQIRSIEEKTRTIEIRDQEMPERGKALNSQATPIGWDITFSYILFASGQADLRPSNTRDINKLVGFLQNNPRRNVLIEGFTDGTGSEASNMDLSERRSASVRAGLINKGVNPHRIVTRSYGESYPVISNTSASGRQINRRVDITLFNETVLIPAR